MFYLLDENKVSARQCCNGRNQGLQTCASFRCDLHASAQCQRARTLAIKLRTA